MTLPATQEPSGDDPAGWTALWQALVGARTAGPGCVAAAVAVEACSAEQAAWLALYQPLLEARRGPTRADGLPWTLAQLGQSLDGCVATASGDSYFVTGPESLVHLHRLRALCDAVLVGAGTVAADDPQLTTRRVPGPHALRVVFDPAATLDGRARLLHDGLAPSLWLCDSRHADTARERLQAVRRATGMPAAPPEGRSVVEPDPAGRFAAEVLAVDGVLDPHDPARGPALAPALKALAARGVRVLLVEGGGVTVSRGLQAGLLDRLHLVVAPVIIGAGRRGLQLPSPARMAECLRPAARLHRLGEDMLWDLTLRPLEAGAATDRRP